MTCDSNGLKRITTKLGTSQTLACFRGSNRARRSVGSDLNYTPGKLVSCRFFFLREFFSRALLSEHRIVQRQNSHVRNHRVSVLARGL